MSDVKSQYREWYNRQRPSGLSMWMSPEWLDMSCGADGWEVALTLDKNQEIQGALPYHIYRRGPFTIVANPPHTPYVGPWISPSTASRRSTRVSYRDRILQSLVGQLPQASYTRLALRDHETNISPWVWADFQVGVKQTMILDLKRGTESIISNSTSKLSHIWSSDQEIEEISWEEYYSFHQHMNASRIAAQIQWVEAEKFSSLNIAETDIRCTAIRSGREIQSAICLVRDHVRCYYLHGASKKSSSVQDANAILLADSIDWAIQCGCEIFDFEGTTLPGVYEFFRKFGAQIVHRQYVENRRSTAFYLLKKLRGR